ncbi:MAG TPA: undecaprenyl-phosphate alpha-N-acetylglucosaminyl 1-phosphate transferase [Ruminiclostridium sp.]|jgi:UDP-GlcNAc:undecaprenyl-phosphate GlcNAc-1-phosphate transferase|nr:undecaprenyl/decaprenyl-phosphate alpha-N-acetylglucosaminyl 1-phosphate transferase [Clostridiaceae bacterium]HAA24507.1 undecaprenyl-phosphate alpha-N-acetylglucosaminyl 1-phosphate transferase [Ruminiclostridium sp.]
MKIEYIIPFAIALIVSFFSSPIAKKIAVRAGAIDVPKDGRRMHRKPVALMGGLAIITGFLISVLYIFIVYESEELITWIQGISPVKMAGFFAGMIIVILLGIYDDIHPLSAKIKFPIQLIAAVIVVLTGTRIQYITVSISTIKYVSIGETISIILSILWIAGITNAINLIDGLDGLAAGVSGIATLSLFVVSVMMPDNSFVFAVLYVALAGAIMGFLPYNFNPAKIFIGSTGAYFLGFILAVISIEGATKAYTALTMVVSLIALGFPIFDTIFAIFRRILKRKPIGQADREHIHHRLIDMGISQKYSVTILYVVSGALGLVSILLANKGLLPAIILVVIISVFVIGGARYLAGIIGDKQEDAGDSGAEQSEPEEKVNENVKKAGAYPSGHTEKL